MHHITKRVKQIEFSLIKTTEFRKQSVCEINSCDLYNKNREPKFDGINDPRMGTIDNNILCDTCFNTIALCPGHFGHIELAMPIYNPLFLQKVMMILNIVCSNCSKLLINDKITKLLKSIKQEKKISFIYKLLTKKNENVICSNCQFSQSYVRYTKDGMILCKITTNNESKTRIEFHADEALKILKNISHDDTILIGMNPIWCHPCLLLFTVYPVVPQCVRPSISFGCNLRSEDDVVYKLTHLLRANKTLKKKLTAQNQKYIDVYKEQLQWSCTTLIDNNIKTIPQSQHRNNGRPLKSLKERIKGKEGRIRGNIFGKRVNYSARTVIDPDPCIKISEIGIPLQICKILTFPEVINKYNYDEMEKYFKNGPNNYPGANYIFIKKSNTLIDLNYCKIPIKLNIGDILHRHLIDTDYVLFNRQPSLHKMSMMGHKVYPLPGKSFRLNPAVTKPYNADFDGDEMNVIVPQSIMGMHEIQYIANVQEQIISPQSGTPIIQLIMDNILGSYLLSDSTTMINESMMNNIIVKIPKFYNKIPLPDKINNNNNQRFWYGTTFLKMLIPESITMNKQFTKSDINKIIDTITIDYNTTTCANFIDSLQIFTNRYLQFRGFSIGYNDIKRDKIVQQNNLKTIEEVKKKVSNYINKIYEDKTKIAMQDVEQNIFNNLNKARDEIGSLVMKSINTNNSLFQVIASKAKGNVLNISQILGSVGQQNIQWRKRQGRVPLIINNRSLPYFYQYDTTPTARGFIEHSYVDGLNVEEFFFHMQTGREGVIDTACKTADVGYLQRKLIKSLEDIKVCYDMTVRNEGNRIVQFCYGTNNIETSKIKKCKFNIIWLNNDEFDKMYLWTPKEYFEIFPNYYYNKNIHKQLKNEYNTLKNIHKKYQIIKTKKNKKINKVFFIQRYINQIKNTENNNDKKIIDVDYILNEVEKLLKFIKISCIDTFPFDELNEYNLHLTHSVIKSNLATKKILCIDKLSKKQFDQLIKIIKKKFYQSLIQPGTSVGPIAAQSIGEPCTQLSVTYDTTVQIKNIKNNPKIGQFIDYYMKKYSKQVITTHITENGKKSYILNSNDFNVFVPSLNYKTEKIEYKKVNQFSKHPLNGSLVKITTESGKSVIATLAHSFVCKRNNIVQTIRGDQLKINDIVPIKIN